MEYDLATRSKMLSAIPATQRTAAGNANIDGPIIDTKGFEAATLTIIINAYTSGDFTPELYHSDVVDMSGNPILDFVVGNQVFNTDNPKVLTGGGLKTINNINPSDTNNTDKGDTCKFGYIGKKRFIRVRMKVAARTGSSVGSENANGEADLSGHCILGTPNNSGSNLDQPGPTPSQP